MGDLTIDFITVQESQYALPSKVRAKLQATRQALATFCFEEITTTNIFHVTGILDPYDQLDLLCAISRAASSMPLQSDHIFVCILVKPGEEPVDVDQQQPTHEFNFNRVHSNRSKQLSRPISVLRDPIICDGEIQVRPSKEQVQIRGFNP